MYDSTKPPDLDSARTLISKWLEKRLEKSALEWILSKGDTLRTAPEDWDLYSSFSGVPRHTGKNPLLLSDGELEKAETLRSGWDPSRWTIDQLGRTWLLLNFAENPKEAFLSKIEKMFVSSDMGEAIALYQSLPLFPYPGLFTDRAAEGIRSNMTSVFNAVALNNPYPADYFDQGAWNQVVLKALFVESPLYRIHGIDRRANKELASILVEFAHERGSAGRPISPELWRSVGPFIDEKNISDIENALNHPDTLQQCAAILALSASSFPGAAELLTRHSQIADGVSALQMDWYQVGKLFEEGKSIDL